MSKKELYYHRRLERSWCRCYLDQRLVVRSEAALRKQLVRDMAVPWRVAPRRVRRRSPKVYSWWRSNFGLWLWQVNCKHVTKSPISTPHQIADVTFSFQLVAHSRLVHRSPMAVRPRSSRSRWVLQSLPRQLRRRPRLTTRKLRFQRRQLLPNISRE